MEKLQPGNPSHPNKESYRSEAVDFLRGIAILMVMICHLPFSLSSMTQASTQLYPAEWLSQVLQHGHYGVQLFLVISGYCIHMRWARRGRLTEGIDFKSFWKRRFARLYPPYLVAIALALLLSFLGGVLPYQTVWWLLLDLVLLLGMMQNMTDSSARVGNGVFWSLALEEQLYLLYFPLLWMRRRRGWATAFAVILSITVLWLGASYWIPSAWRSGWFRAAPAYWFAWMLGALAVEATCGLVRLPNWTASATLGLILTLVGLQLPQPLQQFFITISFFFWLRFALRVEEKSRGIFGRYFSPLLKLGYISYSVYLVHNLAFIVTKRIFLELNAPLNGVLLLRLISGIVAGGILYALVERPAQKFSRKFVLKEKSDNSEIEDIKKTHGTGDPTSSH